LLWFVSESDWECVFVGVVVMGREVFVALLLIGFWFGVRRRSGRFQWYWFKDGGRRKRIKKR